MVGWIFFPWSGLCASSGFGEGDSLTLGVLSEHCSSFLVVHQFLLTMIWESVDLLSLSYFKKVFLTYMILDVYCLKFRWTLPLISQRLIWFCFETLQECLIEVCS